MAGRLYSATQAQLNQANVGPMLESQAQALALDSRRLVRQRLQHVVSAASMDQAGRK